MVDLNQEGECTNCKVCEEVCPAEAITDNVIDVDKCTLCLRCVKECPNKAIYIEDFKIKVKNQKQMKKGLEI